MSDTAIEWTEKTWNPTTGCDKVTPGCDNCYALTLAKRLKGMGAEKYQKDGNPETSGPGFGITEHPDSLTIPFSWRAPKKVFVNSMSDLFHKGISDEFIAKVFAVMAATPRHTYQVLTKRHGRMRSLLGNDGQTLLEATQDEATAQAAARECGYTLKVRGLDGREYGLLPWPLPNVWLGVSVEDQKRADLRIPSLLGTPAAVRFLSCEPLLAPVSLSRWLIPSDFPRHIGTGGAVYAPDTKFINKGIGWVIAGGESGSGFRPVDGEWVRSLRDQCTRAEVPFLFKQWGGRTPKAGGRELDGRTWDEYPEVAA
jgi:protein gp37